MPSEDVNPCWGDQTTLNYARPMRERAAWLLYKHAKNEALALHEPERWRKMFKPDSLEIYGFLRALQWLGLALPTRTFRLSSGELKFAVEHRPFTGVRYAMDRLVEPDGTVYVADDTCRVAMVASGLQWQQTLDWRIPSNIPVLEVAASLPRCHARSHVPGTGIFPSCLGPLELQHG